MKHLLTTAAAVFASTLLAATCIQVKNGENAVSEVGEILAVECNTISPEQAVSASVITQVGEYTNVYDSVTFRHDRYDFTITNYDGNAAIKTNTLDNFSYADWMRGTTNLIVGSVTKASTNITESVLKGQSLKAMYFATNSIGSGTASAHYLKIAPAATQYIFGGKVNVSCGEGDSIKILIK